MNKKTTIIAIIIGILIISGIILTYFLQKENIDFAELKLQDQIDEISEKVETLEIESIGEDKETSLENYYLPGLAEHLQKKDAPIKIEPNDGFFIVSSILSNNKDKIVYSEISKVIKEMNDADSEGKRYNSTKTLEYNIFVKNLITNETTKILSYPEANPKTISLYPFIKSAHAGGSLVYFPIAWSENDQKIILEWGNPSLTGSGHAIKYKTYTVNPDGKEIKGLTPYDHIFINNYGKVIFVGDSDKTLQFYGPYTQRNKGSIILKNIEDGLEKILLEEVNSNYTLKKIDKNQNLTYIVEKVKKTEDEGDYGEVDKSIPGQTKILNIK